MVKKLTKEEAEAFLNSIKKDSIGLKIGQFIVGTFTNIIAFLLFMTFIGLLIKAALWSWNWII